MMFAKIVIDSFRRRKVAREVQVEVGGLLLHSNVIAIQYQWVGCISDLHSILMNLLVKDLAEIMAAKKQRDLPNQALPNMEDLLYRIQLHSVKANLERVKITEVEFVQLCRGVKREALGQPGLLRIDGPIFVCTGTLGNYQQLAGIIDRCGHPKFMNYLFLGDYAGRYDQSVECLVALFAYKLFMPSNFFLLRGCYETIAMARSHHLHDHLLEYFGSSLPWLEVCETFCSLPYAAIVDEKVFCLHGGLSPYLQSLEQINCIPRPLDASDRELTCDLLWADPTNLYQGWTENDRGIGVSFGADVVSSFLKTHDLTIICRAHEVPFQGFRFFADKKLVTICSLSQYCDMANNSSAVMMVDEQSNLLFKLISKRNGYEGREQDKVLSFMDMVQRKKIRESEEQREGLGREGAAREGREGERHTHSGRNTRERKTQSRKE